MVSLVTSATEIVTLPNFDAGVHHNKEQKQINKVEICLAATNPTPLPLPLKQDKRDSQDKEAERVCLQCGVTETPQWRNGPKGPRTLCNACGIRLHRQSQRTKRTKAAPKRRKKAMKAVDSAISAEEAGSDSRKMGLGAMGIRDTGYCVEKRKAARKTIKSEQTSTDTALHEGRPKRKAALASLEYTRGLALPSRSRRSPKLPYHRRRSASSVEKKYATTPESMETADFTAAIDLMSLSSAGMARKAGPAVGNGGVNAANSLGQDLLSVWTRIPERCLQELHDIQTELIAAHWEMQAVETSTRAVAQVLADRTADTLRKRARYFEAHNRLEEFILMNMHKE